MNAIAAPATTVPNPVLGRISRRVREFVARQLLTPASVHSDCLECDRRMLARTPLAVLGPTR
ncbi:hypothetical protein D7D52_32975 [Nocardia yunnanensis]|uniref:Uncharacterized protein n=1 Tax=Nocardia yunnanensis TaxID=2382165 RepID=A0A386ZL15_9NOCA|nr:hypothetical protein [Nocardia yunnanensis]AYF77834.1 hypothetical protein D7D52_32975 [Nocardia yunnanensis]